MTALYPPRHHATRRDPHALTRREREVAELLCTPASGPEIAATLGCAYATFRRHTKALYRKLGVHSRERVVTRLLATGIVAMTDDQVAAELDCRTHVEAACGK